MRYRLQQFLKSKKERFRDSFMKLSFSQCGEDMIVDSVFRMRGIELPTYLDIGANHPFFLSNTAFFYEKGSAGINVEANPNLISNFEKYRTRDINLNLGIDEKQGEMEFFIMEDNTLSTFSESEFNKMVKAGKSYKGTEKVKMATVASILEKHAKNKFPDFLSLDVEGLDLTILKSIDFSNASPKVICVEAAEYSPSGTGKRREDLINYLTEKGYYEYANTNLNAIMVRRDFWFI